MSKRREFRTAQIRARSDGKPGVTLKAINPNVVDDFGSVWMPDVFDVALGTRMPVLCWAHDWAEPLGPATGWTRDADGSPLISFDFSDFEAVPMARRAHAQVGDGTIKDCSVGFSGTERRDPTDDERIKWPGVREVMVRSGLDEVSLVLAGAVPGAKVASVRSAEGGTVSLDAVVELAKKVAAGEMSKDEAKAAIDLLTDEAGESEEGGGDSEAERLAAEAAAAEAKQLEADIDATLEAVGRSKR